jgi:hypothetical protein
LAGQVVARKADGTPYDHVGEVARALESVGKAIDSLKKELADGSIEKDARKAIQDTISALSKYKDDIEGYLGQQ